jgi:adenylosuccinate lyase
VQARRQALAAQLTSWMNLHEVARPHLTGLEPITFDHTLTRLRAELEWHDRLLEELPKLLAAERQAGGTRKEQP